MATLVACVTASLLAFVPVATAAPYLGLMNTGAADPLSGNDEPTKSVEEWDVIKKSGAYLFRMPISMTQSKNGTDWSFYDKVFQLAAERGVTILPFLEGRANGGPGIPMGGSPAENLEKLEWYGWVQKVVTRYGYNGKFWQETGIPQRPVIAWEVLNEPNHAGFGQINPGKYGEYFVYTSNAIQLASEAQAGGKTQVLFGGLAIVNNQGTSEITDYHDFLYWAYQVPGVREAATGIGIHPYALGKSAGDASMVSDTVEAARTFVNSSFINDPTASLWVTELGVGVEDPTHPVGQDSRVTEAQQANFLTNTFNWLKNNATKLNVQSIVWYNYRDSDFEGKWQYRSGLRDEMGNFRRSWFAFLAQTGKAAWPVPRIAFQANTGRLWLHTKAGGGIDTLFGMKAGTSPSIGQYKGSYQVAFQANTGTLWTTNPSQSLNTGYAMAPGTSPSITTQEDGMIAFQSSSGNLSLYKSGGTLTSTGHKLATGTSPSITVIPDRYWRHPAVYPVAFQASNAELWIYENGGLIDTNLGMAAGTNPAIAALDLTSSARRFAVAFQANTGELWIYEPEGFVGSTGYGMKAGTSPSITSLPNGRYAVTFQANTGTLWTYVPGVSFGTNTGYGMGTGTAPSVSALSDAPYYREFEAAFNAGNGSLWTFEPGGAVLNTLYGYQAGTSPSIGPG